MISTEYLRSMFFRGILFMVHFYSISNIYIEKFWFLFDCYWNWRTMLPLLVNRVVDRILWPFLYTVKPDAWMQQSCKILGFARSCNKSSSAILTQTNLCSSKSLKTLARPISEVGQRQNSEIIAILRQLQCFILLNLIYWIIGLRT